MTDVKAEPFPVSPRVEPQTLQGRHIPDAGASGDSRIGTLKASASVLPGPHTLTLPIPQMDDIYEW